jgi:Domain of unknown function DUF1828
MTPELLSKLDSSLRAEWCSGIAVRRTKRDRIIIDTPFFQEDGDALVVFLDYEDANDRWVFSDEGSTIGRFPDRELTPAKLDDLRTVAESNGGLLTSELAFSLTISEVPSTYQLMRFLTALNQLDAIKHLVEDTRKPRFSSQIQQTVQTWCDEANFTSGWHSTKDDHSLYGADFAVAAETGLIAVFAVSNSAVAAKAALSIDRCKRWKEPVKFLVPIRSRSISSPDIFRLQNELLDDSDAFQIEASDLNPLHRALKLRGALISEIN